MPPRSVTAILLAALRDPRAYTVLGFTLGSVFVYLTVRGIDWGEVRTQLADTSPIALLLALTGTLASALLRSLRWRLLFVGKRVKLLRLFTVEMAGLGLNNVSPVRLLDEPVILTMLTLRDKLAAPTVVATLLMSRVQDIAMSLGFIAAAVAFEPTLAERAGAALLLSGLLIGVLILLLNLGRVARRVSALGRIPGVLAYGAAVEEAARYKRRLLATASLTVVYSLLLGPSAWVLANGMGVEINLFQATIVALGAIIFATAMPGLPGAFGAFELAAQEILSIWGVPRESGFGFGLVLHLTFFLPPTAFAAVVLPREGISLLRAWRRPAASAGGTEPREPRDADSMR